MSGGPFAGAGEVKRRRREPVIDCPPNSWTFPPYSVSGKCNVCGLEGCAGSVTGVHCTVNDEHELKHGSWGEGGQVEADLKVKKPTAPLKDTTQNRIGSPDITLRNYTAWCKIFPCA